MADTALRGGDFMVLDAALALHMHCTGSSDCMTNDEAADVCHKLERRLEHWSKAPPFSAAFDGAVRLVLEVAVADYIMWLRRTHTVLRSGTVGRGAGGTDG